MLEKRKIAIIYDWLDKWGGVERVLLTFHEMFPEADFFTSYFDKNKAYWAKDLNIKTSFIQKLPKFIRRHRIASLPFYPIAFETFSFNDYDLVISVTSSFAKSIITQPKTKHICYLLTPTRFLWSHQEEYLKRYTLYVTRYTNYLKDWDLVTAQRPDRIISISETVRDRCKKYYKRNSTVVYPPFDTEYWENIKYQISKIKNTSQKLNILKDKNFFLVISRLEPYKKVDLVVKLINQLDTNLVIVGEGTEENHLRKISGKNITFLSKVTDQELAELYSKAEALIMPQEEDFGYVSLEAQFFGCPAIAFKKGGAMETIIDDKTGIFFIEQSEKSLARTIARFNKIKYNLRANTRKYGAESVKRFNKEKFIKSFRGAL